MQVACVAVGSSSSGGIGSSDSNSTYSGSGVGVGGGGVGFGGLERRLRGLDLETHAAELLLRRDQLAVVESRLGVCGRREWRGW